MIPYDVAMLQTRENACFFHRVILALLADIADVQGFEDEEASLLAANKGGCAKATSSEAANGGVAVLEAESSLISALFKHAGAVCPVASDCRSEVN